MGAAVCWIRMQRVLTPGFQRILLRCGATGILALGTAAPTSADGAWGQSEPWPITEFRVVSGGEGTPTRGSDEIGRILGRAGRMLEKWGFPSPVLGPVLNSVAGPDAYGVFLVRGLRGAPAEYLDPACSEERPHPIIVLDADQILEAGSDLLTAFGTANLIHELLHAVQAAFPAFRCTPDPPGQWIREGSADAVAWDLTRRLRGPRTLPDDRYHAWGGRDYSEPLPVPGVTGAPQAYATSSFWRYLAEYAAMAPLLPGPSHEGQRVDYSYLVTLMSRDMGGRDCLSPRDHCRSEVEWLDAGLRSLFGLSLRDLYARFIQNNADYGRFRVLQSEGGRSSTTHADWLETSFAHEGGWGCAEVRLRVGQGPRTRQFVVPRFKSLAARCWEIDADAFEGRLALRVATHGPGAAKDLNQLTAVLAGSAKRLDPARLTSGTSSLRPPVASWCYDHLGHDEPVLFLLTNVADEAAATRQISDLVVTFELADGC